MPDLTGWLWALLAVGAVFVGLSKTALPGSNTVSIAIFAAVLPARSSTGTLLLLLIVGDVFALWLYRHHANWPSLVRLIPTVIAGLLVGAAFLWLADDFWVQRVIAVVLLLVIGVTLWRRRRPAEATAGTGRLATAAYGTLGGFTTMVANAGGPVMTMYFLASRFSVKAFLGTAAWFFAIVNLVKVPFSVGLGIITVPTLLIDLVLVPAVVIGAFLGRWLIRRIDQKLFERLVIALTILGAGYLLLAPG